MEIGRPRPFLRSLQTEIFSNKLTEFETFVSTEFQTRRIHSRTWERQGVDLKFKFLVVAGVLCDLNNTYGNFLQENDIWSQFLKFMDWHFSDKGRHLIRFAHFVEEGTRAIWKNPFFRGKKK